MYTQAAKTRIQAARSPLSSFFCLAHVWGKARTVEFSHELLKDSGNSSGLPLALPTLRWIWSRSRCGVGQDLPNQVRALWPPNVGIVRSSFFSLVDHLRRQATHVWISAFLSCTDLQQVCLQVIMFNLILISLSLLLFGPLVQASPLTEPSELLPRLSFNLRQRTTPPYFPDTPPSCPICQKVRNPFIYRPKNPLLLERRVCEADILVRFLEILTK